MHDEKTMELQGTMDIYVDETQASGMEQLEELTDKSSKTFKSKKKETPPFLFAYININKIECGYFLEQENYAKSIRELETKQSLVTFPQQDTA